MSLGIRSRMKRHLSTSQSELHFHGPLRSQMCCCQALPSQRARPHAQTLNTGRSEGSVMREDRDGVDFSHGTLSVITGPSLRGFSHLDGAALQASSEEIRFAPARAQQRARSTKSWMQHCSKARGPHPKLITWAVVWGGSDHALRFSFNLAVWTLWLCL